VTSSLSALRQVCADRRNVMPPLIEAVKTYATVGEISDVMREVFATYEEPAVF
jgi:methylmalonyl-CoA mutase N-terminal domain/subunit